MSPTPGGGTDLIYNGGFESGLLGWTANLNFYADEGFPYPHAGLRYAYLSNPDGSPGNGLYGDLTQEIMIPAGSAPVEIGWWWNITTAETALAEFDSMNVALYDTQDNVLLQLAHYSNLDAGAAGDYLQFRRDISEYAGQTVRIRFVAGTDASAPTLFRIDDVTVTTGLTPSPTPSPTVTPVQDCLIFSGATVRVINSASAGGLNVRECAGLGCLDLDDVNDGDTGIILAGPEAADGFVWWQVDWDGPAATGYVIEQGSGGECRLEVIFIDTPSPTPSPSASPTRSPSPSPTLSPTITFSPTPSPTDSPTASPSPSSSPSPTLSPTITFSPTPNPTDSPSPTPTPFCGVFAVNQRIGIINVNFFGGTLNARDCPSLDSIACPTLFTVRDGDAGSIVGGPTDADGLRWWLVFFDSQQQGWVPEFGTGGQCKMIPHTPTPTPSPSASPSPSPTESPSPSPSPSPTDSPTASPTESPSPSPSPSDSPSPTASPTDSPTASPTESPSPSPTAPPTVSPSPSPTATDTPTPVPTTPLLVRDDDYFRDGPGSWLGAVVAGDGSVGTVGGLCMTVPGPGDNVVGWVSPERFVELVDGDVYRMSIDAATDQTGVDSIPFWTISYSNFQSTGFGNNYGGQIWFMDVGGGAQGVGRLQGRTTFEVWGAPNAMDTMQWRGLVDPDQGAFTSFNDASNDMRFDFRILDNESAPLNAAADLGTICVRGLRVYRISASALSFLGTRFAAPITSQTYAPETSGEAGEGAGFAAINNLSEAAIYQLTASGPGSRKSLFPYDQTLVGASFNERLYPVAWESERLYKATVLIQADGVVESNDPVDVISLAFDNPTSEIGVLAVSTRGSPPDNFFRTASPRLASTTGGLPQPYTAWFHSNNETVDFVIDNSHAFRAQAFFLNNPDIAPDGTGGDPFSVRGIVVEEVRLP